MPGAARRYIDVAEPPDNRLAGTDHHRQVRRSAPVQRCANRPFFGGVVFLRRAGDADQRDRLVATPWTWNSGCGRWGRNSGGISPIRGAYSAEFRSGLIAHSRTISALAEPTGGSCTHLHRLMTGRPWRLLTSAAAAAIFGSAEEPSPGRWLCPGGACWDDAMSLVGMVRARQPVAHSPSVSRPDQLQIPSTAICTTMETKLGCAPEASTPSQQTKGTEGLQVKVCSPAERFPHTGPRSSQRAYPIGSRASRLCAAYYDRKMARCVPAGKRRYQ